MSLYSDDLRDTSAENIASSQMRQTRSKQRAKTVALQSGEQNQTEGAIYVPELDLPMSTTTWKTTNYKINPEKSIDKKLSASLRNTFYHYSENGNGWNIQCQAGIYEILRRSTCQFYARYRTAGLEASSIVQRDLNQAIVQVTFKIKTNGGQVAYTVDLYHTNSSLRIAGRRQEKFFDTDWPKISLIIDNINKGHPDSEAASLNKHIRNCLEHVRTQAIEVKNNRRRLKALEANNLPPSQADLILSEEVEQTTEIDNCSIVQPTQENFISDQDNILAKNEDPTSLAISEPIEPVARPRDGQITEQAITEDAQEETADHLQQHRNSPVRDQRNLLPHEANLVQRKVSPESQDEGISPKHPQVCENCIRLRTDWNLALSDIQNREKKCTQQEKTFNTREKELDKIKTQVETQKAVILGLENRVKELTGTNRLLQQIIEASDKPSPQVNSHQAPTHSQAQQTYSETDNRAIRQTQEEVRKLQENLRLLELEQRLNRRLDDLERRLTLESTTPPVTVPYVPPYSWAGPNIQPFQIWHPRHIPTQPRHPTHIPSMNRYTPQRTTRRDHGATENTFNTFNRTGESIPNRNEGYPIPPAPPRNKPQENKDHRGAYAGWGNNLWQRNTHPRQGESTQKSSTHSHPYQEQALGTRTPPLQTQHIPEFSLYSTPIGTPNIQNRTQQEVLGVGVYGRASGAAGKCERSTAYHSPRPFMPTQNFPPQSYPGREWGAGTDGKCQRSTVLGPPGPSLDAPGQPSYNKNQSGPSTIRTE